MERSITGFHADDEGHWVAELGCGHARHVRHNPPSQTRPWVLDPAERNKRLGTAIECVRCDRLEIPKGFAVFKTTEEFDEGSLPEGLKANHRTAPGVWARIVVLEGALGFTLLPPIGRSVELAPGRPGIVPPEVPHHVTPGGAVRFRVEFLRAGGGGDHAA